MSRPRRTIGEPVARFVVRWYRAVAVSAFGFFALLLLWMAASSDNIAVALWVLVWMPPMLFVAVRSLRSATIEFRDDEVLLCGVFRTKRIAWARIRRVDVGRGTSAALLRWRVPYFELDDGSTVRADEIRSLREPSIVDDVVAEARRRLER